MMAAMLRCCVLGAALLAVTGMGRAEPVRVCISDIPYPPFLFPDRDGSIQWLLKKAAARAGVSIELPVMPIKRCMAEMVSGRIAARVAGDTPVTRASLSFPSKAGAPDADLSLGYAREMAFRLKDGTVDWDGHSFVRLNGTVLMQPGFSYTEELMQRLHVNVDIGGKTLDANLGKLLAGRGDIAIGFEFYAPFVLARPEFTGKIEMLPIPVHEATYYLTFAPDYYKRHRADVERLWTAAAEIRRTPAYEALKQSIIKATLDEAR